MGFALRQRLRTLRGTRDGGFADPCRRSPNPCSPFRTFRLRVMGLSTAFLTKTLARRFGPGNRHNVMP